MARLRTGGAEIAVPTSSAGGGPSIGPEGQATVGGSATLTRDTSFFRSGVASWKAVTTSGASDISANQWTFTGVSGTTYFVRVYFAFSALPANSIKLMLFSPTSVSVRLTTGGKIQLWNDVANTQIGSDSAATITADSTTFYRVELSWKVGIGAADNAEAQLDGVSVASTTGASITDSAPDTFQAGIIVAPNAVMTAWMDDFALNDDTAGTGQTSWPGNGKAVLLLPTADSAVGTGWTLGTGTAISTNGFGSVDNTPPIGVADLAAGSDPKQIRNAASAANSNYDATMTTYTAAGIGAGATVNVVDPVTVTAAPVSTSAKQGTVGVVSNPAITNVALSAIGTSGAFWSGVAAGTWPTGWKWSRGTTSHAPSVTLGTAPVMRITQVTSSTRIAMVCFMGMYVDYTPAAEVRTVFAQPTNYQDPGLF